MGQEDVIPTLVIFVFKHTSYGLSFRILRHAMRRSRSALYASGPNGIGTLEEAKSPHHINQVPHLNFKELVDDQHTDGARY